MARTPDKLPDGSNRYDIDGMCKKIEKYINDNRKGVPILKECCLLNDWDYDYVITLQRGNEELKRSTRKILNWKEVQLEKGALSGKIDKTMAIFSLKQLGWTDKQEQSVTVEKSIAEKLGEKYLDRTNKKTD